jgi:HSP20 family protein
MKQSPQTTLMINPWPMRFPSVWDELMEKDGVEGSGSGLSVSEDEASVYVEAALPGIDPATVDISLEDGAVYITGQAEGAVEGRKYYRKTASEFNYSVVLPSEVDDTVEPKAESKNGILWLTFSKVPKAKAKKISIKTSK